MNDGSAAIRLAATILFLAALTGCAKQIEGTYSGEDAAGGEGRVFSTR